MNYILLMTEGTCEQEFLNILLDRNLLKFNQDDLLMDKYITQDKLKEKYLDLSKH